MSTEATAPTDGATTEAPETTPATEAVTPEVAETESKPEGEEAEDAADKPDDEDAEPEGDKPKRASRTARLKNRIRELESEVEAERRLRGASSDPAKPPQEADFNGDYAAYERAQRQFETAEAVRKVLGEQSDANTQKREAELRQRQAELYRARAEEAKAVLPDFDKTLEAVRSLEVSNDVTDFIRESDKGPYLAYHFAKNPTQLAEINGMSSVRAARELARIEARLSIPEPKKRSTAPAPVRPLQGGATPALKPGKSMSEYERWRNSEG